MNAVSSLTPLAENSRAQRPHTQGYTSAPFQVTGPRRCCARREYCQFGGGAGFAVVTMVASIRWLDTLDSFVTAATMALVFLKRQQL